MSESETRLTQDVPGDARIEVYRAGLETRLSEVNRVKKERNQARLIVLVQGLAIGGLSWALVGSMKLEKVYVFEMGRDSAGRNQMVLLDNTLTHEKADLIVKAEWWIYHLRVRSLDKIADKRVQREAKARVTGSAAAGWDEAVRAGDTVRGVTRTIDFDSFSATELNDGEGGYLTWILEWTEEEWQGGALKRTTRMLGTVNITVRPPDAESRALGNKDGVWISFFDINPAPDKNGEVAYNATNG